MALFLSGLVGLLWTLSIAIALPTLVLVALVLAFQLATLVIPAIVEYSAFQSPQAQWLRWILFHTVHGIACTIHWAAYACLKASGTQLTTSNELSKANSKPSTQVSGQGMKRGPTSADKEVKTRPVESNQAARPDVGASKTQQTTPSRLEALDRFVHRLGELCKHCSNWVMNEKHYLDDAANSMEIDSKLFAATFATAVTKDDQPTLGYIQRCLHDMPLDLACSNAAALWVACDNARLDNAIREAHESDNNSQKPADSPAEPSQATDLVSKPVERCSQPADCTSKPTAASSRATDRPPTPADSSSKPSVHGPETSAATYQAAGSTPKPVDGMPAPMDGAKKPVGLPSQPSGDGSVPKDTDCSPPPAADGKKPAVNSSMPPYSEPNVGWHYDSLDRDVTNMMAEVLIDVITRLVHIEPKDLPKSMRPVERGGVVAGKIIDMCGKLNNLLLLLPSMGDGFAYHHLLKLVHISRNAELVTQEARKSILDLLWNHADHHFDLQDIAEIKETINASHGMEVDYNMKLELIMLALHIHILRKDNANDVLTDLDKFLKISSRSQFERARATERSHVDILFSDLAIYINSSDHQSDVGLLNRVVCRLTWLIPEDNGFRFCDPSTSRMRDTSLTEVLKELKVNGEEKSYEPLKCAEDDSGGDEKPTGENVNESRPGQSNLEPAELPQRHIKHSIEQLPYTMLTGRRRRRGSDDMALPV
ncbi:hypothetical protein DAEQUDRAFT_741704 [Daedalea quercina L-15889]|uniref:Uncharacterized protein n=1 Tax=Daedalea quercina L-15889 TaxID=1314783 RepID=A0A165KZJ3_9APHY|nr:hypothetical protein DAEQUDRAFT_741704 [Daedalea quercina L-15889]